MCSRTLTTADHSVRIVATALASMISGMTASSNLLRNPASASGTQNRADRQASLGTDEAFVNGLTGDEIEELLGD